MSKTSKANKSIKTNKRLPRTTPPTLEELECLIAWPKDSVGYYDEKCAIANFLSRAETIGLGRITQIASFIEDIWNNPKRVAHYKKMKKQRFEQLGWKEEV